MYQEEQGPNIGAMSVNALLAAGAVGLGARFVNQGAESFFKSDFYKTNDYMKSKPRVAKMAGKFNSGGYKTSFGKEMGKSFKGIADDFGYYLPRIRAANDADKMVQSSVYGRKIPNGTKVIKAPIAVGIGLWTMKAEMDKRGDIGGLVTGAAMEVTAQAGFRIGNIAGTAIGHKLSGGLAFGASAGGMITGAIAGMAGYMAIDAALEISKVGRRWSTPDLGGSYADSATAMTMRQRSMNSIKTSQFNIRNELGREALMLRGL